MNVYPTVHVYLILTLGEIRATLKQTDKIKYDYLSLYFKFYFQRTTEIILYKNFLYTTYFFIDTNTY